MQVVLLFFKLSYTTRKVPKYGVNSGNTELFLVRIFLYLDWICRFTSQIFVFSPNTGKYRPEITPYLDTFQAAFFFFFFLSGSVVVQSCYQCFKLSLQCKISPVWFVEITCIFLAFLIAAVKVSIECENARKLREN